MKYEMPPWFNGVPMLSVRPYLDREKGKPAWILGGGPSLLKQDPCEMADGVQIAVNFSIWAHERLGFPEAKYWIFGDTAMLWRPGYNVVDPADYPLVHKFVFGPVCYMLLGRGYEPSTEGQGREFLPFFNIESDQIRRNAHYLWTKCSTLNAALSLAWTLGCNPINIRGADFGLAHGDGRTHWYDPPGTVDPRQDLAEYEKQKMPIRQLISCIRATGFTVTAEADKSILEA